MIKTAAGVLASNTCNKDPAKNDDISADIFSYEEQERKLRKAKRDEKRVGKEAKKLVKTVRTSHPSL